MPAGGAAGESFAVGLRIALLAAAGGAGLLPGFVGGRLSQSCPYWGLLPGCMLLGACTWAVVRFENVGRRHLTVPSVLFLLCMAYYLLVGSADHWLQVQSGAEFIYLRSLFRGYQYVGLALAAWLVGYATIRGLMAGSREDMPEASGRSRWQWSERPLRVVSLFCTLLGSAAFAVFYYRLGSFPLLSGVAPNADPRLRQMLLGEAHGLWVVAYNASTVSILASGLCLVCFPRRRFLPAIQVFVSSVGLALWGARLLVALPMMIVLVLYLSDRQWRLRRLAAVLAALFALGIAYGVVRNREFLRADLEADSMVARLANLHAGPEFRDMLGVVDHLDELQKEYDRARYVQGILLTAFPQRILEAAGLDKDAFFDESGVGSDWLVAQVTRDYEWGAVRPGIIGQTLMAYGPAGVAVVFVLYGACFAWLDRLSPRIPADSPARLVAAGAAVILAYSVLTTTHGTFAKWWYFLYGCAATGLLACRRREEPLEHP